jgi:predicted phosphodiesterase
MKIALISDIHGNSTALEAVLADVTSRGGVDETWVLGDLVALGPDPVGVLERLTDLPAVRFVRGNTDRYVTTTDRPPPTIESVQSDPARIANLIEIASSFTWTQGAVSAIGRFDWLANLPLEIETTLPDGTHLLGVHASPGRDDGPGFAPDYRDQDMLSRLQGAPPGLVCAGHTHHPLSRRVGDWHVVNLGSVSNPPGPDKSASYVILHAGEAGYQVEHRRVSYDLAAVLAMLERQRHPGIAFIAKHFRT